MIEPRPLQPDSQKTPFTAEQLEWIKHCLIDKNFRDKEVGPVFKGKEGER